MPFSGEGGATYGVDAPFDDVQATCRHTTVDRIPAQAQIGELRQRHDSVLVVGERGGEQIDLMFAAHIATFVSWIGHDPSLPGNCNRGATH